MMEIEHFPISIVEENVNEWTITNEVITKNQENAFYVCDINNIIQKYRIWKELMPRVKPYYAVKCNNHPIVLRVLAGLGLGFDCASKNEINQILSLDVDPNRIIYAHTTKPLSHIQHAANVNVTLTTFDNEMELQKLKKWCPNARTLIRIRHDGKAICSLGSKFGCDANIEAPELLQKAKKLGANVVGVSFHVGTGCTEPYAFSTAIKAARDVFDYATTVGYNFSILDIGGGYPGEKNSNILKYATVINKALKHHFPEEEEIKVMAEPGTYFVASAFTLICNIHSIKKNKGKLETTFMYYINDGIFGSFGDVVYYNLKPIPQPLKSYTTSKKYRSIIWGPTCDSLDQVTSDILLPEMEQGDWLAFSNMGAYTLTTCSAFNGFEKPDIYAFMSKNNWLLLDTQLPFIKEKFCNPRGETTISLIR